MKQICSLLFRNLAIAAVVALLGLPAVAQSPTVITRTNWATSYGGPYEIYYQAVPTSSTNLDSRDVHLLGYCVYNNTGGSLTFTIQSRDGSPLPLPVTGAIGAGSSACNNSPFGILVKGGFSVVASGSGLYYQVVWRH
jgi:hypothetical protein